MRGRGFFRGAPRGGAPRFNMTLDNRPKQLLLKSVNNEHLQAVRDWYEVSDHYDPVVPRADHVAKSTGQLQSVDVQDSGDLVVTFKTRPAAEQVSHVLYLKYSEC